MCADLGSFETHLLLEAGAGLHALKADLQAGAVGTSDLLQLDLVSAEGRHLCSFNKDL